MGKAYTEEEREQIRTRLLETGLALFHEGVRNISIRELTRRAGIAQGGFYSFFQDKEDLVIQLAHYRIAQKMHLFEEMFDQSLEDPAAFVSAMIFRWAWGLKQRAERNQMYGDIFRLCMEERPSEGEKLYALFYSEIQSLTDYWDAQGLSVTVDAQAILNVMKGALILYANLDKLDEQYSETLLRTFIDENCKKYIS